MLDPYSINLWYDWCDNKTQVHMPRREAPQARRAPGATAPQAEWPQPFVGPGTGAPQSRPLCHAFQPRSAGGPNLNGSHNHNPRLPMAPGPPWPQADCSPREVVTPAHTGCLVTRVPWPEATGCCGMPRDHGPPARSVSPRLPSPWSSSTTRALPFAHSHVLAVLPQPQKSRQGGPAPRCASRQGGPGLKDPRVVGHALPGG